MKNCKTSLKSIFKNLNRYNGHGLENPLSQIQNSLQAIRLNVIPTDFVAVVELDKLDSKTYMQTQRPEMATTLLKSKIQGWTYFTYNKVVIIIVIIMMMMMTIIKW